MGSPVITATLVWTKVPGELPVRTPAKFLALPEVGHKVRPPGSERFYRVVSIVHDAGGGTSSPALISIVLDVT
jgi:hypothetical protein